MMRRLPDDLVLSFKDQIRTLRYSLRSEAEAPGSALPEAYRHVDFGPLGTVGAMIGAPVLRMADGLFTQVETVTSGLFDGPPRPARFPCPITGYFSRSERVSFTHDLYSETKAMLRRQGARQSLVAEHTIEDLRNEVLARHGDLIWSATSGKRTGPDAQAGLVQACAAVAAGYARIRPIQKVDFLPNAGSGRHMMLAPNLYCGLALGLSLAIATIRPEAGGLEGADIIESADAVVDARFDRFRAATDAKDAVGAVAREFEAVLPFLP